MARIAILERADMNTEQTRVYDAAKQSSGIVGGPYPLANIVRGLPKPAGFSVVRTTDAPREQIVNLVVARHWNARYPWFCAGSTLARRRH